jgi:hypothetical protein
VDAVGRPFYNRTLEVRPHLTMVRGLAEAAHIVRADAPVLTHAARAQ